MFLDSYGFDLDILSDQSVKLKLGLNFDPTSLPPQGKVSLIIEVRYLSPQLVSEILCYKG